MPYKYQGKITVDGLLRGVTDWGAACGSAVVHLDADGGDIPCSGMHGTIPVNMYVQRTIKRAELLAFYMALVRLSGPACIYTDNFWCRASTVKALDGG